MQKMSLGRDQSELDPPPATLRSVDGPKTAVS